MSVPRLIATYPATVLAVHDGDTCTLAIEVTIGGIVNARIIIPRHVRVLGINAPELSGASAAAGEAAHQAALALSPLGATVTLGYYGEEKFGRVLGSIKLADGRDFAAEMVAAKQAKPWDGSGTRP